MDHKSTYHPDSPILNFCPPTLPAHWYVDPEHFKREQTAIHAKHWIYVCRENDLPELTLRQVEIAGQKLLLVKDDKGVVRCFHNTCRHRGSELCQHQDTKLKAKLITCPYHGWTYDLAGQLLRTPHATTATGFDKHDNGLFTAQVKLWNGFIYVTLADEPPDFALAPDLGEAALRNWPMQNLVTGHRLVKTIACNWKIFWDNYNECLHCPGIHASLCDMVPVYGKGVMSAGEAPEWTPDDAICSPLKAGARTWTKNGQLCGPEFQDLTDAQRQSGYFFVTLMPTMYIVAHTDYVRAVSLRPLGPEETELTAEWLFPSETLAAKNFDLANVVDFATTVLLEDGAACELNQRGLNNNCYTQGTLMPQEFDVFNFHQWVRSKIGEPAYATEMTT